MRSRLISQVAVLGALAIAAAGSIGVCTAVAAQSPVVSDCVAHGRLASKYSTAQLRTGLSTMSAEVKEYTNCYDVIQRALLVQLGSSSQNGNGSGSGSGDSFLPTPVIVVLVVLALGAVTFAAIAIRRRRAGETPGGTPEPPG